VGLNFTSANIATSLSLMGPVIFLAQLVLFPLLSKRFSALVLWRASAVVLAIVYPIFSLLPQVSIGRHGSSRTMQWTFLLTLLTIRFTASVVSYTSMAVLIRLLTRTSAERGCFTRESRCNNEVSSHIKFRRSQIYSSHLHLHDETNAK